MSFCMSQGHSICIYWNPHFTVIPQLNYSGVIKEKSTALGEGGGGRGCGVDVDGIYPFVYGFGDIRGDIHEALEDAQWYYTESTSCVSSAFDNVFQLYKYLAVDPKF